jgi:hypothetical protein
MLLVALYPASIAAGWFQVWPWPVLPPTIMVAYIFSDQQRTAAYLHAVGARGDTARQNALLTKATVFGRNLVQYGIPFGLGWTARYVMQ